jgi:2-iminobutanoate/2-iminopropanoate deaminase
VVAGHQSGKHQAGISAQRAGGFVAELERIHPEGHFKGNVPLSPATKAGRLLNVSGTPGYDNAGRLGVDFAVQMRQAMANISRILEASGAEWNCVMKVNVMLTRRQDFPEMNRIYAEYFPTGNYPARTTVIVASLPQPNFLVEIDCQAMLRERPVS